MNQKIHKQDLLYPEESYAIIGVLFDVYNTLGPGHRERIYQRAIAEALKHREILHREQVYYPLRYGNTVIGRRYFDFLIGEKIVLEIKRGDWFSKRHIDQVLDYLKASGYKLAILANFGREGITFKRIVNFGDSYIRN